MKVSKATVNRLMTLLSVGFLAAAGLTTLSACNTVEGVGEDVEAVGDAVSDTARDAKD